MTHPASRTTGPTQPWAVSPVGPAWSRPVSPRSVPVKAQDARPRLRPPDGPVPPRRRLRGRVEPCPTGVVARLLQAWRIPATLVGAAAAWVASSAVVAWAPGCILLTASPAWAQAQEGSGSIRDELRERLGDGLALASDPAAQRYAAYVVGGIAVLWLLSRIPLCFAAWGHGVAAPSRSENIREAKRPPGAAISSRRGGLRSGRGLGGRGRGLRAWAVLHRGRRPLGSFEPTHQGGPPLRAEE
jgi:hypothetical protein